MEVLSAARAFHYNWSWRLDAAPLDLWPLVADTNRFNHDAGVPPVASAHPDFCTLGQGRRELSLRRFGVLVAWEEHAFEWVRPRHFSVLRRYTAGPVGEMRVDVRLEPDGAGTVLHYDVTATPASVLGVAAIPFQIGVLSRRQFAAVFRRYGDVTAAQPVVTPEDVVLLGDRRQPMAVGADVRLDRAAERLGDAAGLWRRLREVLERAVDADVDRLRPYALADQWAVPRRDALRLFLRATRAGVLQLRWDLLCPLCRGTQATADTLAGLALHTHCPCCHVDVSADFDRSVELAFRPTDAVRPLTIAPYCVGGPQVTPHVAVQQLVGVAERRTVEASLDPGRYRVRALDRPGSRLVTAVAGGPRSAVVVLDGSGWCGDDVEVACDAVLELRNESNAAELFIVERLAWTDTAVVAADVFALQEFRDLFSAEALRPGERVMVGAMTILFTDLRESTALYDRIGDAPAFGQVLDHFHALRSALEQEHGAIVKTIGDAVMAVFTEPAAAIRTVLRAHEMLAADADGIQPVQLKCGAHYGSCIAVTLNERLDYFGSTVNMAARLGGLSQGGDIVLSEELFNDPGVTGLVRRMELVVSSEEVLLKGYSRPVRCYRLRPARVFASRC